MVQIPLTYWIWDGFNQNNTKDYQTFNSLFGEVTDTYTSNILTSSCRLILLCFTSRFVCV